jgi:hypothetical protein
VKGKKKTWNLADCWKVGWGGGAWGLWDRGVLCVLYLSRFPALLCVVFILHCFWKETYCFLQGKHCDHYILVKVFLFLMLLYSSVIFWLASTWLTRPGKLIRRNLIINSNETCFPITWDKPHVCLVNAHFSNYEYITSLIKSMACVFPFCWLCLCAREPLEKICHMFISSSRNSCCYLIQDISPALLGQ